MKISATLLSIALAIVNIDAAVSPRQSPSTVAFTNNQGGALGYQLCIMASGNYDGAPVIIHDCVVNPSFTSFAVTPGTSAGPVKIFGNKCLDVTNGVNQVGTKLQIWTCGANNRNQQFIVGTSSLQWANTNKCVDLTNSNVADGTQLQLWTCDANNNNQRFPQVTDLSIPPAGEIVSNAPAVTDAPVNMIASAPSNGAPVVIADRHQLLLGGGQFPNNARTFTYPAVGQSGPISAFNGQFCIDVVNGVNADGTKLQVYSCVRGNRNQLFTPRPGPSGSLGIFEWSGTGKCIDLTNGVKSTGNQLQIWTCTGGANQSWLVKI